MTSLLSLFERERVAERAHALGIIVDTDGSTYQKRGALMVIAANGDYAGLLSGGCLEGDLREHARGVIGNGAARSVRYELSDRGDVLWGLGAGCEGAMEVLLIRVGIENGWQPLAHFASCYLAHRATTVGIVVKGGSALGPSGSVLLPDALAALGGERACAWDREYSGWVDPSCSHSELFLLPLTLPPRVLLLGAGPDTAPVVDLAARLGWRVTLVDHRPAYAEPGRFPKAERVVLSRPELVKSALNFSDYVAAVVMSHHLPSDLAYLQALADSPIPYVGLLGPAPRRERLLTELGAQRNALQTRLRAPVGLALGGRGPESIALAIVAEMHAFLHGTPGGPFSANR
jgi:xanthine/CO dehydrogenase XdhC/CoxF family maturation factor